MFSPKAIRRGTTPRLQEHSRFQFCRLPRISLSISLTAGELNFTLSSMSCARIFVSDLHSLEWVGILLARVAVGLLFFLSGRAKLFVPERRDQMRQTLIKAHVPFPEFNAAFVSTVEFVCGLFLVLGAVTPLASALLAGVIVVAIATTAIRNIKATSPAEWLAGFLYLPEVLIW